MGMDRTWAQQYRDRKRVVLVVLGSASVRS